MKGISPFIAEILLIGFTVAIATIIITWGTSFTRTSTQTIQQQSESQLVCSHGGISTYGNIYFSNGYLYGYLRNTGNVALKVHAQISYDNTSVQSVNNLIPELNVGSIAFFNVSVSQNINFVYFTTNCTSPPITLRIEKSEIIFS